MGERAWIVRLLALASVVCLVVGVIGLVVFIWGSASPSRFVALGRIIGFRPTGLALLVGGVGGGLVFLGHWEMVRLLGEIARGRR